jgi:NADH:ubiquinone oxidoreductase subunit B-like Fe-S oxidoreductase
MNDQAWFTSRSADVIGGSRKWSLFLYPFATACCSLVYVRAAGGGGPHE